MVGIIKGIALDRLAPFGRCGTTIEGAVAHRFSTRMGELIWQMRVTHTPLTFNQTTPRFSSTAISTSTAPVISVWASMSLEMTSLESSPALM
jgi:hypothetical protein